MSSNLAVEDVTMADPAIELFTSVPTPASPPRSQPQFVSVPVRDDQGRTTYQYFHNEQALYDVDAVRRAQIIRGRSLSPAPSEQRRNPGPYHPQTPRNSLVPDHPPPPLSNEQMEYRENINRLEALRITEARQMDPNANHLESQRVEAVNRLAAAQEENLRIRQQMEEVLLAARGQEAAMVHAQQSVAALQSEVAGHQIFTVNADARWAAQAEENRNNIERIQLEARTRVSAEREAIMRLEHSQQLKDISMNHEMSAAAANTNALANDNARLSQNTQERNATIEMLKERLHQARVESNTVTSQSNILTAKHEEMSQESEQANERCRRHEAREKTALAEMSSVNGDSQQEKHMFAELVSETQAKMKRNIG
jgi:hypothetical protein